MNYSFKFNVNYNFYDMNASTIVEDILARWRKAPKGPAPKIDLTKIVCALKLIEVKAPIGRYELSKQLGLSQGVVRGLINRLKIRGLIEVSRRGCKLTASGRRALIEFLESRNIVDAKFLDSSKVSSLAPGPVVFGVRISKGSDFIGDGIAQRDAAIKAGASGATTLIYVDDRLRFPSTLENVEELYPSEALYIIDELTPTNGDVLILCWADSPARAFEGAISAALSIEVIV